MVKNKQQQQHAMRLSLLLIVLGVLVEVSVMLNGFALKQDWPGWTGRLSYESLHRLFGLNSIGGLLGAFLLFYGAISFAGKLRISRAAFRWVCLSGALYIGAKAYDVVRTLWDDAVNAVFVSFPYIDELIWNMLIVASAMTLLAGMIRALYNAHRSRTELEHQNRQLDREMRGHQEASARALAREAELTTTLNALNSPVILVNREGYVLAHNAAFAEVCGDRQKSFVGEHLRTLLPPGVFEEGKKQTLEVLDEGQTGTLRWRIEDRVYDVNAYPVYDESGARTRAAVLARDITDKLKAEEEQRLLEASVTNAAESIMVLNRDGLIEYVNPAFEVQTGYSRAEATGQSPRFLDGETEENMVCEDMQRILLEQGVWRGHLIRRRKNGKLYREAVILYPIVDDGEITHYITVGRDITQELKTEEQLRQARMLQALAVFAGGVAHDLNNTLAIILGRSEIAMQFLEEKHPVRQYLDIITKNANRSVELIKRLLTFARQKTGVSGPLYAVPLLQAQLERLRGELPDTIQVRDHVELECDVVKADPATFESMVEGLMNNAVRAMQPKGGQLDVRLENVHIEEERRLTTGMLNPGGYVLFCVSDTGCGMSEDVLRRMFEPFFTTRRMEEGIGLALSEVYGNVLQAGGHIQVDSAPGQGTQVEVYWPRAGEQEEAQKPPVASISGTGISVLLIDDMEDFVTMMTMELEQNGFTVVSFDDPKRALGHISDNPDSIDVAVVDYSMPGMNGAELTRALHDVRSDLPVVLLTGYSAGSIIGGTGQGKGFGAVVEKPIRMGVLPGLLTKLVRGNGMLRTD